MKIGLVCPYNIGRGGGVQEIVRAMQVELQKRGHSVKIITPEPRGNSHDREDPGVIYMGGAADFRSPLHTTAQLSASIDPDKIDAILAREKFEILHFHEPWVPMLSRQVLSRSTSVNIATFHAKMPQNMMSRTFTRVVTPYTKSVLKYLHELTAVSDAAAEYVCELTDRPVAIIPNGININHFAKPKKRVAKPASARKTILYVGRLERRKGVNYLLKAFHILQEDHDNVSLIIAGDGPDRTKLEELAYSLELRNVTFAGYISEEEKVKLLHTSDLFCAPAVYGESFGIVLLEAMASGLVTVAANNPGYSSVMQGVGALSLVNPHDTTEFARRLDLMLREDSLRKIWRNWATDYVAQFDYTHVVDQYEEIYEQALAQHRTKKRRLLRLPKKSTRSKVLK